jgi:hypothetical protein
MTGCLNETNWVGGERESYYVAGYCDECLSKYKIYGTARRYNDWLVQELLSAIGRMLRVPDKFDEVVRSTEHFQFWIKFCAVVVATNIMSGMLLDLVLKWDLDKDTHTWFTHVKTHWLAGGVALVSAALAVVLLAWHLRRHHRLP